MCGGALSLGHVRARPVSASEFSLSLFDNKKNFGLEPDLAGIKSIQEAMAVVMVASAFMRLCNHSPRVGTQTPLLYR